MMARLVCHCPSSLSRSLFGLVVSNNNQLVATTKHWGGKHFLHWSSLSRNLVLCPWIRSDRHRHSGKQHSNQPDPRRNVRYPYVQGDPIHEDTIKGRSNKSGLSTLQERDRKAYDQRQKNMKQQTSLFETEAGLKWEKLLEGDIRLGRTVLAAKSSEQKADTILLEGQRLITDALLLGAQAKCLYFCNPEVLNDLPSHLIRDIGLYKILYKDMKIWSDAVTPSGILGVFQKPQEGEAVSPAETTLPVTLIFDSLKDPGNVGTLIRTAAAIGCECVIAMKGTVNVWDSKVLRSAMGGHFSVPIYSGLSWADIPNYLEDRAQIFLASTWQSSVLASTFNERLHGEDLDRALEESEASGSDSDSDDDSQFQENKSTYLSTDRNSRNILDEKVQAFQRVPLTICDYSNIVLNLASSNNVENKRSGPVSVALVLGGETEGLSIQAKKFAYKYYGQYVTIPMSQTVNSLNTGIAGSIILYELRKKLLEVGHPEMCGNDNSTGTRGFK